MASIDLGGRAGARKSIDATIPLVPFIDLLLCCVMRIPVSGEAHDVAALREKLALYRNAHATLDELSVSAEDGVAYQALIGALDAARAEGFESIAL